MTRLDDLRALRNGILARMETADSDQNYTNLGRLLVDVVKQIDELSPGASSAESGLSEFERRMRERQSASSSKGRARKAN